MKTQTLVSSARRVVIALALGAAATAEAVEWFWTGEKNNFNTKVSWVKDGGQKMGDSGNAYPGSTSSISGDAYFFPTYNSKTAFHSAFEKGNYLVNFYNQLTGTSRIFFKNAGTAAKPILFKGSSAANGLTVKTSWAFSDNGGDSYVTFQSGTFGGGSWTVGGTSNATAGHLAISNGVTISTSGNMNLNNGSVFVAGSLTANQIRMGGGSGRTATLTIEGGTVTNASGACYVCNASGATGTLYLNEGGTLVTRNVFGYSGGTATVVFNGGTLKAKSAYADYGGLLGQANTMTVTVGEKGGTIDNGGYGVLVSRDLAGAMSFTGSGTTTIGVNQSATGSMTVGGGTVALNAGLTVARPVAVDGGATLKAIGAATLSGGVAFADGATLDVTGTGAVAARATFPASGTVTLTLNGGAFAHGLYPVLANVGIATADVVGKLVPTVAEDASWAYCVNDGTLYLAVDMDDLSGFVWTGAAGDGKMSTGGNWWSGVAPGAGDAVSFAGAAVNVPVYADIDATFGAVTMGSGIITFSGSLAATSFSDTTKIAVAADSIVTLAGDLAPASSVVYSVASGGKFVVTGTLTLHSWGDPQVSPGDGTIVAGEITGSAGTVMVASCQTHSQKWAVGPGGITGGAGAYLWTYSNAGAAAEFRPWTNDFAISVGSVVRTDAKSFTLNTDGLDGAAHTITLDAGFADYGDPLNVTGTGKVVVNHVTAAIGDRAAYSGAVEVKDSATLAINAGKKLTSGAMTVNSAAALEVAESGEVALGGDLTLRDGAMLKFNFTERKVAPVLKLTDKTVTFGNETNITVSVNGSVRPVYGSDGKFFLTSGGGFPAPDVTVAKADDCASWVKDVGIEDGNLYASVVPAGLMILFR